MGGKNNGQNYESQARDRQHSDNVRAGEHNHQQDETQYGKTRENETGFGKVERKAEEMKDKVDRGFDKAENKMNEWGNKAEDKMNEWGDKSESKLEDADRKMDKADKKVEKAQEKFAKGYENDGERKMEKAEKKMDKAQDKIEDAHEERNYGEGNAYHSSRQSMGGSQQANDNAEDYQQERREEYGSKSQDVNYGQNTANGGSYDQDRPRTQH